MYKWVVRRTIRRVFAAISRGDWNPALGTFADDVNFRFPGVHELAVSTRHKAETSEWFDNVLEVFPTLRLDIQGIAVAGRPWDIHSATRFVASYSMPDGEEVRIPAIQHLNIVWGRVKSDHIYLDSQVFAQAIERAREQRASGELVEAA